MYFKEVVVPGTIYKRKFSQKKNTFAHGQVASAIMVFWLVVVTAVCAICIVYFLCWWFVMVLVSVTCKDVRDTTTARVSPSHLEEENIVIL